MKVKDIILAALKYIGRDEIAPKLTLLRDDGEVAEDSAGDAALDKTSLTAEEKEVVETLTYCFNSVEDELARCYIPLHTAESMSSENGVYEFAGFKLRPLKIFSVKSGGKPVKYSLTANSLVSDCTEITVEYGYAPLKKGLDDKSEFSTLLANERLVAAGVASEYCLIDGEAKLAESWESVYRGEIDALQRTRLKSLRLPPRRWV